MRSQKGAWPRTTTVRQAVRRTAPAVCDDAQVPTVVIVDDHPSFRASARAVLDRAGSAPREVRADP
jgi:hypothetical protein